MDKTYLVVDKNNEVYIRYIGSYGDCLRLIENEQDDFKRSHRIISDREYTRIVKRKPLL